MRTSKPFGTLSAGLSILLAASCGEPFAYVGAGGHGGAGGGHTTTTTSSSTATTSASTTGSIAQGAACDPDKGNQCAEGLRCKTYDCKAGTCQPLPTFSPGAKFAPVCGCDGIAYWNHDLALEDGVSYAEEIGGTCNLTSLRKCLPNDGKCDHTKEQFCDRDTTPVSDACPSPDGYEGVCVRMPKDCSGTTLVGTQCPEEGGCALQCELIRHELPWKPSACTP